MSKYCQHFARWPKVIPLCSRHKEKIKVKSLLCLQKLQTQTSISYPRRIYLSTKSTLVSLCTCRIVNHGRDPNMMDFFSTTLYFNKEKTSFMKWICWNNWSHYKKLPFFTFILLNSQYFIQINRMFQRRGMPFEQSNS